MKRTFTLALAAAATFAAAAPAHAALTSAGVACKPSDVSPDADKCSGWWVGNLLQYGKDAPKKGTNAAYDAQQDAVKALFDDLGFPWTGKTVIQNLGDLSGTGGVIDFTGVLSGKTIIGIHRGNAGVGDKSQTAFFLWNNLKPSDKISLDLGGLSGSNLYLTSFTTAVPEPATWLLMIAGVGLVGWQLRRRRQTVKVSYA